MSAMVVKAKDLLPGDELWAYPNLDGIAYAYTQKSWRVQTQILEKLMRETLFEDHSEYWAYRVRYRDTCSIVASVDTGYFFTRVSVAVRGISVRVGRNTRLAVIRNEGCKE